MAHSAFLPQPHTTMTANKSSTQSLKATARRAAALVIVFAAALISLGALIGWGISNLDLLIELATFGRSFWATACLGLLGLALCGWATTVVEIAEASDFHGDKINARRKLVIAIATGWLVAVMSCLLLGTTASTWAELDIYQQLAAGALVVLTTLVAVWHILNYVLRTAP
ncbi:MULTISPECIES: hypothetical protein [Achromobacter]|uniref:Transmembrane protein n=1 Tax=Achromobacter denitrificans TaxID=32002 RepID=A0ABZ3FUK4_ACHDE|nr:hypothetical protein [Achromobacter piechaudii]